MSVFVRQMFRRNTLFALIFSDGALPGDDLAQGEPAAAPMQAAPDPEPPKAPEPPAPPTAEDVAHLPYPFNLMTPDAVPEYVWKQAREAKAKVKTNPH